MKTLALEINDVGLLCAGAQALQPASPGYALLSGNAVSVGEPARRAARLDPRNVDNRFWHELDDKPLSQPAARGRSRADLAYLQLKQIWEELRAQQPDAIEAVACAVPATLRPPQLALLLGVAHACGIPLRGFIDSAVAVASTWRGKGRFVYVDVHLHQAIGTAVEVGAEARRERVEVIKRAGLVALQDAWMHLIARLFIARTRFDPLHQASTEQKLFDALPDCLDQLSVKTETDVELTFNTDKHRAKVTREEVLLQARPFYESILLAVHRLRRAGSPLTIALSARAAALPGLAESFVEFRDCEVLRCLPACSALAAAIHAASWSGAQDAATLFRAAPLLPDEIVARLAPVAIQAPQAVSAKRAPTHVLYKGKAHALSSRPLIAGLTSGEARLQITGAAAGISPLHCSLLRQGEEAEIIDFSRYGTWLNEERVTGRAPLHAGDRLRIGSPGVTLELIAIDAAPGHAAPISPS